MRFIKNYLYNRTIRANRLWKAQENIAKIHSVLVTLVAENKTEAESVEARHLELIGRLRVNDEQLTRQIFELKESLDKFLQSQAGMNNIIKKFFKLEIDNAMAESVMEKEEPTEHDKIF